MVSSFFCMNEDTGEKCSNFNTIKNDIEKAVTHICELFENKWLGWHQKP